MSPQPAPGEPCLALDVSVFVSVCGDCESVSYEPCANIFVVAHYSAQKAAVLVDTLNPDLNVLAADRFDQCALDEVPVIEPVAVLVFRQLVPLGCIEAG